MVLCRDVSIELSKKSCQNLRNAVNFRVSVSDMNYVCVKRKMKPVTMSTINKDLFNSSMFDDVEMYNSPTPMTNDDIWKKFDLTTPPLSPTRDDDMDLENITVFPHFDMMLFDDDHVETTREVFPESPPDLNLQSNLIQDPMWSDPPKISDIGKEDEKKKSEKRLRCDSCSRPNYANSTCVAPEDIFPYSIGGAMSQTRVHDLGIETPSDSGQYVILSLSFVAKKNKKVFKVLCFVK